jgi:bacteriocin-like protein
MKNEKFDNLTLTSLTEKELSEINGGSEFSELAVRIIGWCIGAWAAGVREQSNQIMENDGYTVCL